jgi:transposase
MAVPEPGGAAACGWSLIRCLVLRHEVVVLRSAALVVRVPRRAVRAGDADRRPGRTVRDLVARHRRRWRDLPEQLGCGSGQTAWRRLREWQDFGVWDQLHQLVPLCEGDRLAAALPGGPDTA